MTINFLCMSCLVIIRDVFSLNGNGNEMNEFFSRSTTKTGVNSCKLMMMMKKLTKLKIKN